MDRLTYRDADGRARLTLFGKQMYCSTQATADCFAKLEESLAAYKDTGLEPKEITEYLSATDEYVRASEEGRLIVLPSDPYEMADVAQEILSRACRLQREAEAALGGDENDD